MSNKSDFFDLLLEEYSKSFDITKDYENGPVRADAYGYFSTISEKYVLSPKANLWSIHGFEHILFIKTKKLTVKDIEDMRSLMEDYLAPTLVCKGGKYPEKDHMYSYLTAAFLCETTPDEETIKALKSFKYEKNYLMTIRGHVEGHMVLMDLSTGKAYANKAAKHLSDFYEKIFSGSATEI
jgi:hypothetical protein